MEVRWELLQQRRKATCYGKAGSKQQAPEAAEPEHGPEQCTEAAGWGRAALGALFYFKGSFFGQPEVTAEEQDRFIVLITELSIPENILVACLLCCIATSDEPAQRDRQTSPATRLGTISVGGNISHCSLRNNTKSEKSSSTKICIKAMHLMQSSSLIGYILKNLFLM